MSAGWVAVLDDYEHRLDAFEAMLGSAGSAGSVTGPCGALPDFEPPAGGLPVLDGEPLARSVRLLERSRELEARGERRLAETTPPARPARVQRFAIPRSHRLDTSV